MAMSSLWCCLAHSYVSTQGRFRNTPRRWPHAFLALGQCLQMCLACNLPQLSTTPNKPPHTNHGGNTVQSPDDGKQSGIRRCTPLSLPICAFGCVMHGRTSKAVAASAPPSTLSASSAATVLDSCEAAETGGSLAASGSGFFLCRFFAGDACVTTVGLQHLWMPPTATPLVSNPTKPLVWCGVVWF